MQQRQLTLAVEADLSLDQLCVPRGDLLQVLLNLVNNAIDCSSEGSRITLCVREEPEMVRIAVSDEGSGISPDILPHIFDPFFTTKMGNDQKGMGLGLSVSQSLVLAMGGTIDVSTQPDSGSTFTICLPRNRVGHVSHV
ncbi:MAG: sensor histidine kinase [Nitrospira sp.]